MFVHVGQFYQPLNCFDQKFSTSPTDDRFSTVDTWTYVSTKQLNFLCQAQQDLTSMTSMLLSLSECFSNSTFLCKNIQKPRRVGEILLLN